MCVKQTNKQTKKSTSLQQHKKTNFSFAGNVPKIQTKKKVQLIEQEKD